MAKALVPQALHTPSAAPAEDRLQDRLQDRLSLMRCAGLGLDGRAPDATTLRLCREPPTRAGAVERLFEPFST